MVPDIQPWRPNLPESGIKPTERLNATQKADVIRMSRVEAILQETLAQEGMPNAVSGEIWRNEEDATFILWTKNHGFFIQWQGPATYLQVKEVIKSYGEDTVEFFSHFPKSSEYTNPQLRPVTNRIKAAVVAEPTPEELQRLPEILAANHRRVSEAFLFQIREAVSKGEIWGIPRDLESAKENAREAGISIDPQLEHDIFQAYHLRRRQLDFAQLPKIRGDVMRRMDPFVDRIIESDDFLGEEHPDIVKSYAGRAALQALRIIRDYTPLGFNDKDSARARIRQFELWEGKALKWANAAGIDITQQLEALRTVVNSETQEALKPIHRRILDRVQRTLTGEVAQPRALVPKPDLGPEDKEIEPAYQDDISVLIKTNKGRIIGAQLRNDKTNQDFRIVFPLNSFSQEEILAALDKTFPGAEVYHSTPDFLPTQEKTTDVSDRKFAGIRIPLKEEKPVGGSRVRALWLTVRDGATHSFGADTLASPNGPIENFYFPYDSLNIKIEGEFDTTGTYVLGDGWVLHPAYHPLTEAEWSQMHQKLGTILEHLFESGNVVTDSITSMSIHPGSGSPLRPEEFTKKAGYHLEKAQQQITVEDGNNLKTTEKPTVDYPNREAGKFVFQDGENQFGIINRRNGYLISDLYTLVKFYPEGLHFNELTQEIEKLRVM
ncbi:MAG: hypothetical protein HYV37_03215 [Candidatus Levyibacteriota bacterium]|nr:MAG: hypothetical protein HYV37_03215 [Candidatus Levybacteria bacterium]